MAMTDAQKAAAAKAAAQAASAASVERSQELTVANYNKQIDQNVKRNYLIIAVCFGIAAWVILKKKKKRSKK